MWITPPSVAAPIPMGKLPRDEILEEIFLEDEIHEYPGEDAELHSASAGCPCHPFLQSVDLETGIEIWVHRRLQLYH